MPEFSNGLVRVRVIREGQTDSWIVHHHDCHHVRSRPDRFYEPVPDEPAPTRRFVTVGDEEVLVEGDLPQTVCRICHGRPGVRLRPVQRQPAQPRRALPSVGADGDGRVTLKVGRTTYKLATHEAVDLAEALERAVDQIEST